MVLLHILCQAHAGNQNTNEFRVDLPTEIHGQVFTLKKSVIAIAHNSNGQRTHHTVLARIDRVVSQHEVASNHHSNGIPLSFDPTQDRTESDYHVAMKFERVPRAFTVKFFSPAVSATGGVSEEPYNFHTSQDNALRTVELWFEYADNSDHYKK